MKVCKIGLTLNTNISRTALVLKLKFSGLSNFIYWEKSTKFQLNLRESPGDLIKNLLSWHGMIRNEFLKNAAWSRMINFLKLSGDDANLGECWLGITSKNVEVQFSDSNTSPSNLKKIENFSQSWWKYIFQRFERKLNKYSEER